MCGVSPKRRMPLLKSKFFGALIGTGVGDALGAPFEGWSKVKFEKIKEVAERLWSLKS